MARIITKRRVFWLLATIGFVGAIVVGYQKWQALRHQSAADRFRTAAVRRGDIKFVVKCTGTVQPVLSVQVGSYVSGPIKTVCVDFNDKVEKDQLLAELDPQVYKAQCLQAQAALARSIADMEQCKAKYNQTEREFKRAEELHKISDIPGVDHAIKGIADSDYDLAKANYEIAAANVLVAKSAVEQNQGALDMAETNLSYTEIRSPVDGIVIDRRVDAGQTLASQFQTPVMFVVAPDLDKKVYVLASVDEADIGLIRKAEANQLPVRIMAAAYLDEPFTGKIKRVRLGPKATQPNMNVNVVTYIAEVEVPNTELKLLPGMTAELDFQIEIHEDVLKIPNAALRYHPRPEYVHPKHLALLEGLHLDEEEGESAAAKTEKEDAEEKASVQNNKTDGEKENPAKDANTDAEKNASAGDAEAKGEKTSSAKTEEAGENSPAEPEKAVKKYVWVIDGNLLSPVEVKVDLTDKKYTEMVSGELKEGQKVVTGLKTVAEMMASQQAK